MFDTETSELARLRDDVARLGAVVAGRGRTADALALGDLVEQVQQLDNTVQALQLTALAHLGSIEHRITPTGTVEVRHDIG